MLTELRNMLLEETHLPLHVMAGLVPAIHDFAAPQGREDVDANPSRMFPTWVSYN